MTGLVFLLKANNTNIQKSPILSVHVNILVIDALASNDGKRRFTRDAIGAGPRVIANVIEKHSLDYKIVRVEDLLEENNKDFLSRYSIFLISAMSVDEVAVLKVIEEIRKVNSCSKIILGGPIVESLDLVIRLGADIGVKKEGENILNSIIVHNFDFLKLYELSTKNKDTTKELFECEKKGTNYLFTNNSFTQEIFLQYPSSTQAIKHYKDLHYSKVYVEIVRGCSNHYRGSLVRKKQNCPNCGACEELDERLEVCPSNIPPGCGFCSVPSTFGTPRSKPIDLIEKEVKELFAYGVNRIVLSAPDFLDYCRTDGKLFNPNDPQVNLPKIEELLSTLTSLRDQGAEKRVIAIENVKPSLVTEEVASIIGKYLPLTTVSIGCETFDSVHSAEIGRPSDPFDALRAAKYFSNASIRPHIYLIHSLPGETVYSLDKTINVIKHKIGSEVEKITVYKYLPLPNSPFVEVNLHSPSERYLIKKKRDELKRAIIEFNTNRKQQMIGTEWEVIVAEQDSQRKNTYYSYPILGGPAITLKSDEVILNKTVKVKILDVISDRLVKGEIIS